MIALVCGLSQGVGCIQKSPKKSAALRIRGARSGTAEKSPAISETFLHIHTHTHTHKPTRAYCWLLQNCLSEISVILCLSEW
jgi:hypothetical protein